MTRTRMICLTLIASAAALTGCSSQQMVNAEPEMIALADLGPLPAVTATVEPAYPEPIFLLGAGDTLGREMFSYYVACLYANQHYATGADDRPESD